MNDELGDDYVFFNSCTAWKMTRKRGRQIAEEEHKSFYVSNLFKHDTKYWPIRVCNGIKPKPLIIWFFDAKWLKEFSKWKQKKLVNENEIKINVEEIN